MLVVLRQYNRRLNRKVPCVQESQRLIFIGAWLTATTCGAVATINLIIEAIEMAKKTLLISGLMMVTLIYGCASQADQPFVDIGGGHGNLRSAQEHIVQAWRLVSDAQYANNGRLDGHAARAKELLSEANDELRAAADVANEHEE